MFGRESVKAQGLDQSITSQYWSLDEEENFKLKTVSDMRSFLTQPDRSKHDFWENIIWFLSLLESSIYRRNELMLVGPPSWSFGHKGNETGLWLINSNDTLPHKDSYLWQSLLPQFSWTQTSLAPWELEIWRAANVSALSKLSGAHRDANDNMSLSQMTQRMTAEGKCHTEQREDNTLPGPGDCTPQTLWAQLSSPSVTIRNNFLQELNLMCKNFSFVSAQSPVSDTPLVFHKHLWKKLRMSVERLITNNSENTWAAAIWSLKYLWHNFADPDLTGCFCFVCSSISFLLLYRNADR